MRAGLSLNLVGDGVYKRLLGASMQLQRHRAGLRNQGLPETAEGLAAWLAD